MATESDLCSPFSPKKKLSQKESLANQILMHSKDVWNKIKDINYMKYLLMYRSTPLVANSIYVGKKICILEKIEFIIKQFKMDV